MLRYNCTVVNKIKVLMLKNNNSDATAPIFKKTEPKLRENSNDKIYSKTVPMHKGRSTEL